MHGWDGAVNLGPDAPRLSANFPEGSSKAYYAGLM